MKNQIKSKLLLSFIKEIQYKNRNPKDTKALKLLDDISTNPERVINVGEKLYRARIVTDNDTSKLNKEQGFYGFNKDESFIAPWQATKDMRANYKYIPYLYCANNPYLALAEVRPVTASKVSIATLVANQTIRMLDFSITSKPNKMSVSKQNLFLDLSRMYSKPVTSDDNILDYIPTQYVAEYAKQLGYDGIMFTSSVVPEFSEEKLDRYNVVIFNYQKCEPIKSNVFEISTHYFDCIQIDNDTQKLPVYNRIDEILGVDE